MGTKSNPGKFDCYAEAGPDEPMFVLLGRDRHAPLLVRLWALLRHEEGEEEAKVREALECAEEMEKELRRRKKDLYRGTDLLELATAGMDEHPEGYDEACLCNQCCSNR